MRDCENGGVSVEGLRPSLQASPVTLGKPAEKVSNVIMGCLTIDRKFEQVVKHPDCDYVTMGGY